VPYRVVVRRRAAGRVRIDLYDQDDRHTGHISDDAEGWWRCEVCGRRFRGGVSISAAIKCCVPCLRQLACADSEELLPDLESWFGEGLASANRAVESLEELVGIYSRWRFIRRWRLRREALGVQRSLAEYTEYLGRPEGQQGIASMIYESRELVAIVDQYF
jgi:hypothetical protein